MKGRPVAPAEIVAEASTTQSNKFRMASSRGKVNKKMAWFPDPFSVYKMDHLCGGQSEYFYPLSVPIGYGAVIYIVFYAWRCWRASSRLATACLPRGRQPPITASHAG